VFDEAGELVGILVAGATDFVVTAGCVSVNICPNSSVATCQNFMGANSGSASADCINANGDGCQGETVTGTNVLSSALVLESGCSGARPCLNGGTCNATNLCECPAGFTGPNCIQTLGTAFCNGATGTGWLTCPLIVNGVTLATRVNSASGLRCGTSATGTTVGGAHYTGQSSPEVFFGLNLTETTTVTVDTCGSSFDTLIHVWNQSTLIAFVSDHTSPGVLALNDDIGVSTGFSCTGTRSGLNIALSPGVYIVQVEGCVLTSAHRSALALSRPPPASYVSHMAVLDPWMHIDRLSSPQIRRGGGSLHGQHGVHMWWGHVRYCVHCNGGLGHAAAHAHTLYIFFLDEDVRRSEHLRHYDLL
jgi:hypothetical protein